MPAEVPVRIPLSLLQEHMLVIERLAAPLAFNDTARHRGHGRLDEQAWRGAVEYLVERHEPLRTSFRDDEQGAYQCIAPSVRIDAPIIDLRGIAGPDRERELVLRLRRQDGELFDLAQAPPFRACCYRLADDLWEAAFTLDHVISDDTTIAVLVSEFEVAYQALAAGRRPELAPLGIQYADYAAWQRAWMTDERQTLQLDYWRTKLADLPLAVELPYDRRPTGPPGRDVGAINFVFPAELRQVADRLCRLTRSTLYMLTVALVQAMVARYTGQTDLVVGTTYSTRDRPELDGLVGLFAGVGVVRTDLTGDPAFETILSRTRDSVLGLFEHVDVTLDKIWRVVMDDRRLQGAAEPTPVPVTVSFFRATGERWVPGSSVVARPPEPGPTTDDLPGPTNRLGFRFYADDSLLWGTVRYQPDSFDASTIERFVADLHRLLAAVGRAPALRLSQLPVPGPPAEARGECA